MKQGVKVLFPSLGSQLCNIYQHFKHLLGPCDIAILSLKNNQYKEYVKETHGDINYNSG